LEQKADGMAEKLSESGFKKSARTLTDATLIKLTIQESKDGSFMARGEFGRCDVPTENKRVYPRALWEREINKIQEAIKVGKVLGHLDHPADGKTSLARVSHIITCLEITPDGQIIGEAKILDNEHGKQLKSILQGGGAIGISSRGMGSTAQNSDGIEEVQDDYQYMTHDFVADPAVQSSYPEFFSEGNHHKDLEVIKDESPKETVMETNNENKATLTESVLQTKLEEQKVELTKKFAEELPKKIEEAKEKFMEEAKNKLLSDPEVAGARGVLDQVKTLMRPFVLPEDVDVEIKKRDDEIASLKESLEKKDAEIKVVEEKAEKIAAIAQRMGMRVTLSKEIFEDSHKDHILKLIGDIKQYETQDSLKEAVVKAKSHIADQIAEEKAKERESKKITEALDKKIKQLEDQIKKRDEALTESMQLAKNYGLQLYLEKKIANNPNGPKIRQICVESTSKKEIDQIVEKFKVDAKKTKEYNLIQERLKRGAEKNPSLVEDHVNETGTRKRTQSSGEMVTEGLEGELQEFGMSYEDIEQISNV